MSYLDKDVAGLNSGDVPGPGIPAHVPKARSVLLEPPSENNDSNNNLTIHTTTSNSNNDRNNNNR